MSDMAAGGRVIASEQGKPPHFEVSALNGSITAS